MRLYRRITYGDLAQLSVLDTRQYRTEAPCGYGFGARCAAALDKSATMTGPAQERWLLKGLGSSGTRWNVIAQQLMMSQYDYNPNQGKKFNTEAWDGYVASRNRILGYLLKRRPSNPIIITGDMHSSWVADLKADFREPSSETVGVEFVATSITSKLSDSWIKSYEKARNENPHVNYFDARSGGYVRCDLTPERWRLDLRLADSILDPQSPVRTIASFVVENGNPGAQGETLS